MDGPQRHPPSAYQSWDRVLVVWLPQVLPRAEPGPDPGRRHDGRPVVRPALGQDGGPPAGVVGMSDRNRPALRPLPAGEALPALVADARHHHASLLVPGALLRVRSLP